MCREKDGGGRMLLNNSVQLVLAQLVGDRESREEREGVAGGQRDCGSSRGQPLPDESK